MGLHTDDGSTSHPQRCSMTFELTPPTPGFVKSLHKAANLYSPTWGLGVHVSHRSVWREWKWRRKTNQGGVEEWLKTQSSMSVFVSCFLFTWGGAELVLLCMIYVIRPNWSHICHSDSVKSLLSCCEAATTATNSLFLICISQLSFGLV